MALWGNDDRETSKPRWLTERQKRDCIRIADGWIIPTVGIGTTASVTGSASGQTGKFGQRSAIFAPQFEKIVSLPNDASATSGAINSAYAGGSTAFGVGRFGNTGATQGFNMHLNRIPFRRWGLTAGADLVNYPPYFTQPLSGDTIRIIAGQTAYFPVIMQDPNWTDIPAKLTLTAAFGAGATFTFLYGASLTQGAVPTAMWNQKTIRSGATATVNVFDRPTATTIQYNRYGGIGGITAGLGVLVFGSSITFGNYTITLTAGDGRGGTASIPFTLAVTAAANVP